MMNSSSIRLSFMNGIGEVLDFYRSVEPKFINDDRKALDFDWQTVNNDLNSCIVCVENSVEKYGKKVDEGNN